MKIKIISTITALLLLGISGLFSLSGCAINPATTQQAITLLDKGYGQAEKSARDGWTLGLISPTEWTNTVAPDFQKAADAINTVTSIASSASIGDWLDAVAAATSAAIQIADDGKLLPPPGTIIVLRSQPPPSTLPSLN
jgi:hypothetical protein